MLMRRGITPLLLEARERAGERGIGERVDGFSLDQGVFVFTSPLLNQRHATASKE